MADISERYMREIAGQWGYLVTWLPGRRVRLGQTGRFDGMQVNVEGRLADDNVTFDESKDDSSTDLVYRSAGAVSVEWAAGASVATGESAELTIGFSRDRAVLFDVHAATEHRIAGISDLKRRILEIDRRSGWEPRRAVVVSVLRAERSTVMISSGRGALVRCRAEAGQALSNLADPRLHLQMTAERSMHTTIVSEGELTPMYQAIVLRRGLLGSRRLERVLRGEQTLAVDDPLREAVDEDFVLCSVTAEDGADANAVD